jgi:hypothetical protein
MKYYTSLKYDDDGNKIKIQETYTEEGIHISTITKIYDINMEIIEETISYYFEDLDSVSSSININYISKIKIIVNYYKSGYIREQKIYTDSFVTITEYNPQGLITGEETISLSSS